MVAHFCVATGFFLLSYSSEMSRFEKMLSVQSIATRTFFCQDRSLNRYTVRHSHQANLPLNVMPAIDAPARQRPKEIKSPL